MQEKFNIYISRFTALPYWKVILSLLLPLVVLFFAFPKFEIVDELWNPILLQSKNPFVQHEYPGYSHASKLAFRFIPAIIIGWFHLTVKGIIIWQYINGILLFFVTGLVIEKLTKNKAYALMTMLITAFIFTGKVSFINFKDTFDSLILVIILLTFIYSNMLFIFFAILCIGFIDERGLICSGLIILYYLTYNNKKKYLNNQTITIGIAWISYLIIRTLLHLLFGLSTSTVGVDFKTLALNLNFAPLSIWQALEGGWIIVLMFIIYLFKDKKLIGFLYIIQVLILILIALLVFDVTRSLVYIYPILIIALKYLNENIQEKKLKQVIFLALMISGIYPAYCSGGDQNDWNKPLPIKFIFEYFTNN